MNQSATLEAAPHEPTIGAARAWTLHLWAFLLPLLNLAFLLTGPHEWWKALLWTVPTWTLVAIDTGAPPDLRQPEEGTPRWPFDVQVYLLTALQLANHIMLGFMAAKLLIWPAPELGKTLANFIAMQAVSGVTAGYSGIVLGHELVHRRNRFEFFLGRLLLMFVCYEHFATEHIRGHHPLIGTRRDPATARFGETFREFFRRTVPAQWKSAWHLDKKRIGDENMRWYDPRMIRHRSLQGAVAQVVIVACYFYFFGWLAALFFVLQARMAINLLEAVNYIEHWGLTRIGKTVTTLDSWDTDNWFTLHTLVGLSRHSDHHARASRPYHMLKRFEDSPKMPAGYYGTVVLAMAFNKRYIKAATAELKRKQLGPFRTVEAAQSSHPPLMATELNPASAIAS